MSRTFSVLLIGAVLLLLSGCAGISKGPFGQQSAELKPHGIVLPPGWPENTDENGGGRNWANHGGKIIVLGNAQDGGVPHVGCLKECCESARRSGQRLGPSCLAIVDMVQKKAILVEATPAIEEQLAMISFAGRPRKPVEAVLLTHAHIGHYTGLMHFGREVASTQSMPVYCTPKMAGFLEENGPWDQLVKLEQIDLKKSEPGQAITFEDFGFGLKVTPIAVKHRNEYADTVAWRIESFSRTVVFCPDIDRWNDDILETLIDGADVCYLDATFYDGRELPGRDMSKIPHPPMVETMDRLQDLAKKYPGRFRFIHLNHTNPALHDEEIRRSVIERGFGIAEVGESFYLW
ncbi:MAG: MBL fold metallo-hydrolase [Planctomycetes bacterium]|nr:MBL fold metallo-hydrolase [Planctomycetota bacterium]